MHLYHFLLILVNKFLRLMTSFLLQISKRPCFPIQILKITTEYFFIPSVQEEWREIALFV